MKASTKHLALAFTAIAAFANSGMGRPVRPPRDMLLPKSTIEVEHGGRKVSLEIALDEISVREWNGNFRIRSIARKADGEAVRRVVRQRIEAKTPQAAGLVLYEIGKPHLPQHRLIPTREVVVQLTPAADPQALAGRIKAEYLGELSYAPGMHRFRLGDPAEALLAPQSIDSVPGVLRVLPQLARLWERTAVPNDTWYAQQWHLSNTGQGGGTSGMDLNVEPAWNTVKGSGITIGIIDDGVQATHPDLGSAVQTALGYDFRSGDADPSPDLVTPNHQDYLNDPREDFHGTLVAGVAAGRGFNGTGICGVAPSAGIAAIRLLGDYMTDLQIADAFARRNDAIAIKNNSWGPRDDGASLWGPDVLTTAAIQSAVTSGRGGRGTIFVKSAGNGGLDSDNANKDGFANSIETITVGALEHHGLRAPYSELGCNILVCAPAGSNGPGTVTTDLLDDDGLNFTDFEPTVTDADYSANFYGTSASAPMVSGVAALMLQANPNLGWRDVQEILVRTARKVDPTNPSWSSNAAGFHFSDEYGAGLVDAAAAVTMAMPASWTNLGPMRSTAHNPVETDWPTIPDNYPDGITRTFDFPETNLRVEHVQVRVFVVHPFRGDLEMTLVAPSGTESRLVRSNDDDSAGYQGWTFSSVRHRGESAQGEWKLRIADRVAGHDEGMLLQATLTLHGTETGTPVIPATPRNLTVEAKSVHEVELNWEDAATNETGYQVEFSYGWGDPWRIAETLDANVTRYLQRGVPQGVEFHYRVKALTGTSCSGYSNEAYTITQDGDGAVIYQTGFDAAEGYVANSPLGGQGNWVAYPPDFSYPGQGVVSTSSGQQGYVGKGDPGTGSFNSVIQFIEVEQEPGTVMELTTKITIVDSTDLKRDFFYLDVSNIYGYWLLSLRFDNSTRRIFYYSISTGSFVDTGLKFSRGTPFDVKIIMDFHANRWSASTNGLVLVNSVSIVPEGSPISLNLGSLSASWFVENLSRPGDNYMLLDEISIVQKGLAVPATPADVNALASGSQQIIVYWGGGPLADEYEVQHSADGITDWTTLGTVPEDDGYYLHTGLAPGSTHHYRVRSRNALGDSDFSVSATATTFTEYQEWKDSHRLDIDASDSSDDDHDGIPLLMEYALDASPKRSSSGSLPVLSKDSGHLYLNYQRARSDLTYRVETSTNLLEWTTEGVIQESSVSGRWVTASAPTTAGGRRFLRLAVSRP